jgi:uncharacterized protein YciI
LTEAIVLYLATLSVGPDSEELRRAVRADHLKFVDENRDRILFGGAVLADDGSAPRALVMVIDLPSRAEAIAFVRGEPYVAAGVFDRVAIEPFVQRIPESRE